MKIGRNDPCPCGSGLKYKKCCAAKDEEARSAELASQLSEREAAAEAEAQEAPPPTRAERAKVLRAGGNTTRPQSAPRRSAAQRKV